jgi:hypothetical protein
LFAIPANPDRRPEQALGLILKNIILPDPITELDLLLKGKTLPLKFSQST